MKRGRRWSGCRISIGVLATVYTRDLIDEVIDAADVRKVRYRRLPASLMVIFVLSCWLFMRSGYGLVMSKLADAQAVEGRGGARVGRLGHADHRVDRQGSGSAGRRTVEAAVRPGQGARKGTPATLGVFYWDLRVVSMDGFTLDLPAPRRTTTGSGAMPPPPETPARIRSCARW